MRIEYVLHLDITQEPTYWLHEITDGYEELSHIGDNVLIYEPSDAFVDLFTVLKPHIHKALVVDLGVDASKTILELPDYPESPEELIVTLTITDNGYGGDPEEISYKTISGVNAEVTIGSAREAVQYLLNNELASELTEDEVALFHEEIVPQIRSSYQVAGVGIESIEIVD